MSLLSRSLTQSQTPVGLDWQAPSSTLVLTGTHQSSTLTASTALVSDASKNIISSAVTATELGYVSGVTSALQTQLNTAPKTLFNHFADQGNGTTVETDLYSDTIAAGQLGTNGNKLEAQYGGTFVSSGTATREIKIYFGGTAIFDTGTLTLSLSSAWTAYVTIVRVSASVVRYMISFTTQGAALAAYTSVGELTGLTLANTNVFKITGQAAGVGAATNDVVAKMSTVIYEP